MDFMLSIIRPLVSNIILYHQIVLSPYWMATSTKYQVHYIVRKSSGLYTEDPPVTIELEKLKGQIKYERCGY